MNALFCADWFGACVNPHKIRADIVPDMVPDMVPDTKRTLGGHAPSKKSFFTCVKYLDFGSVARGTRIFYTK
jgi:hypothetical protein